MRIIKKSKTKKETNKQIKTNNKNSFKEMWTEDIEELLTVLNEKFPVPDDNPWMIDEPYFSKDGKQRVRFYVHDVMDDKGYNGIQTRPLRTFTKVDRDTGEETTYYNRKAFHGFVLKDDQLAQDIEQTFQGY